MDGSVRLSDGPNPLEGRLEICINNAWGTVCPDEFSSDEAGIVCRSLGFDNGNAACLFEMIATPSCHHFICRGIDRST